MTDDQLNRVAYVLSRVDGGCGPCVRSAFSNFMEKFPDTNARRFAAMVIQHHNSYLTVDDLLEEDVYPATKAGIPIV